jgi:DNA replication protein DnaC
MSSRRLDYSARQRLADWSARYWEDASVDRMAAALLDRLTHQCHIFEMQGESFRFKESFKEKN